MESVGVSATPSHGGGNGHITAWELKQLHELITGNGKFLALEVSHTTRGGFSQEVAFVDPKKYFNVDPSSSFSIKNSFRLSSYIKYRLGTNHSELIATIKGITKTKKQSQNPGTEVLKHLGINTCRDAVKSMVENTNQQAPTESSSHLRELLAETLARQLNEIDKMNDRETAGEEIKKTLDWIDSMLASKALTSVGVGGKLQKEKENHDKFCHSDNISLAYSVPLVKIESSQSQSSQSQSSVQHQGTSFPTLNETLMNVREELIKTQLKMAFDSCATEASLKWAQIHGQISSMDNTITKLNDTMEGLSIVTGSNLDKTIDAIGIKCAKHKEQSFNEVIEPITHAMSSQAQWTKNVKNAIDGLKKLSSGLAQHCTTPEGRAESTRALEEWHSDYKNLLLPNSVGALSKVKVQITPLINELQNIVKEEDNKNASRKLDARIDEWSDKALQAIELSSNALLSPKAHEHEHVPLELHSKEQDRLTQISKKKDPTSKNSFGFRFLPKHKAEYNKTVATVNESVQEQLSTRILYLNQRIRKQEISTLTTMVNIGLRGHNDYISHLKEHIDNEGCKHLANGGYEKLSDSVENSKQLALKMVSHHPVGTTSRVLEQEITNMDNQVVKTLKIQGEFVNKSLLTNHREKMLSAFFLHMKEWAYFDHPSYSTLKENMLSVVKDSRFQERVNENMQAHGLDVDTLQQQLIDDENIVELRPSQCQSVR